MNREMPLSPTPVYLESPPRDWDDWLQECMGNANFCQSSKWAEIHFEANSAKPYWIDVTVNGSRKVGALFGLKKINSFFSDKGELSCFHGPVLFAGSNIEYLAELLHKTEKLASDVSARSVSFIGFPTWCDTCNDEVIEQIFYELNYKKKPWFTSIVDLSPSEDKIFASFKNAARKGIRKSEREGLTVSRCKTLNEFNSFFVTPYYEENSNTRNISRQNTIWNLDNGRYYNYFFVKNSQGHILATLGTYRYKGVATEIMSHRTKASYIDNLPAQDLLHWEVFRFHKEHGDQWFDMAGYSPDPKTPKEKGILRFKQKWGGREVKIPSYVHNHETLSLGIIHKIRNLIQE